jgi:hypothetical protein
MKANRNLFLWSVAAVVLSLVGAGVWLVRLAVEVPAKAYAMWGAGELVVEHLRLNTNQWPRHRIQLERTYRSVAHDPSSSFHSTFEEIHKRVQFDWNADLSALATAPCTYGLRPFRVIRLLNGKGTHDEGAKPKVAVWEYLQTLSNSEPGRTSSPTP